MADIQTTTRSIPLGDDRKLEVDFSLTAANFGTSVSSCAWTIDDGDTIGSLSGAALSSSIATVLFSTTTVEGTAQIRATATMADGQTASHFFCITVEQPNC